MKVIEPPVEYSGCGPVLFLAGGISDAENWQRRWIELLQAAELTVLNPRRPDFDINDPQAARAQIEWEYRHLRKADLRVFWFPPQTLCPIALFELGVWSQNNAPLLVGVDPDYRRRSDIEVQLELSRPDVRIVYSLEDLAAQTLQHASLSHQHGEG